jgi:polysaccharide pyruvyl transferase WcaK-like protein
MRTICLHGYYGNGNMGDDAILFATERIIEQIPNIKLEVVGHPVPFINTRLGRTIAKLPYGGTLLYTYHTRQMLKQTDKTEALILGGGGILCDRKSRDVTKDVRLIERMQSKQKPTMVYAVGVPSLWRQKSKELIKKVVEAADYTSCRDPTSAERIENTGVTVPVHVTGDPATKIPKLLGIHLKTKKLDLQKMNICISLRKTRKNGKIIKAIVKLVNYFIKNYDARIKFIPMRTRWYADDRVVHNFVRRNLNNYNVSFFNERPSVEEFVKELIDTTLTIGVPLHSTLLSASMGVPYIAIRYTPDILSFMEYVHTEQYALSLTEACDGRLLIEKTEELLDSYATVSKQLLQNIKKIEQKTLLDEKAIREISGDTNFESNKTS